MKRLPKGKTAQVMGSRFFQTMYTAEQMRKYADKAVEDEREACAKVCDDKARETFSGQCQVWGDHFARAIRART